MRRKFEQNKKLWLPILLTAAVVLVIVGVLLATGSSESNTPERPTAPKATGPVQSAPHRTEPSDTLPEETIPEETPPEETVPVQTLPPETDPEETEPDMTEPAEPEILDLGEGLFITQVGSYSGVYMEDGADEMVSDVLMILVENDSDMDFQLADIELIWNGESFTFRLTNLPAGASVVLLEQGRKSCPDGFPEEAKLFNSVTFSEAMSVMPESVEVTGLEHMLNVRNISGTDITGDIYIYYKYASEELFYGGITFRVRIQGGLKDGELRQIPAGHFTPDSCKIIQITVG